MAANDYIRTVNITPLGTAYAWDTPPSWITINRVGTSNDWTITVSANTGAARSATLTVRHDNGSTTDTINVTQAGVSTPSPTPTSGGGAGPTPTPTSGSGAGPTPTPTSGSGAGPTPTPTSNNGSGLTISFDSASYTLDDASYGAGSSTVVGYAYSSSTNLGKPLLIAYDTQYTTVNISDPLFINNGLVQGNVTITSTSLGDPLPISRVLEDLIIQHPASITGPTASIAGYLIEAENTGGFGGGCLIAGTKIALSDNTLINIENLTVGNKLMSTVFGDMPNTDDVDTLKAWSQINPTISSDITDLVGITPYTVDTVYNFNSNLIVSSGDHVHIIKRDNVWMIKEAKDLVLGDVFMTTSGEVVINSINVINEPTIVYKLDVETNDTFIANGVVTHNNKIVQ